MRVSTLLLATASLVAAQTDELERTDIWRGYNSPCSFDLDQTDDLNMRGWMGKLPDSYPINWLSIPGAYDTSTYMIFDTDKKHQDNGAEHLLRGGIRYLDVRLGLRDDELFISYGRAAQDRRSGEVFGPIADFLEQNGNETVILRVRENGPHKNSTLEFEQAWRAELGIDMDQEERDAADAACERAIAAEKQPFVDRRARSLLATRRMGDALYTGDAHGRFWPLPTLGALRGKVLIIEEFPTGPSPNIVHPGVYGIPYVAFGEPVRAGVNMLEDYSEALHYEEFYKKWPQLQEDLTAVAGYLNDTVRDPDDRSAPASNLALYNSTSLWVTHAASAGWRGGSVVPPVVAAAGEMGSNATEGINDRLCTWLDKDHREHPDRRANLGIVALSFPGQTLVRNILARNEHFPRVPHRHVPHHH